jgi:hypothetical protein
VDFDERYAFEMFTDRSGSMEIMLAGWSVKKWPKGIWRGKNAMPAQSRRKEGELTSRARYTEKWQ